MLAQALKNLLNRQTGRLQSLKQQRENQTKEKKEGGRGQQEEKVQETKKETKKKIKQAALAETIEGKNFFLALHRSCLKLNLKISRPLKLLARNP